MDGELIYTYEFKLRKGEEGPKMMFNFFPRWLLVETLRVTGWTAEKNLDSIQFNRGPVSIGWSCLMFQIKYVREFHGASSFFFRKSSQMLVSVSAMFLFKRQDVSELHIGL